MKKALSLLLTSTMLLGSLTLPVSAAEKEEEHILFEDDFVREAVAWGLQGSRWKDGHVELHTTGWQWARLVDDDFKFYNPYTVEFDLTYQGKCDGPSDWISFNIGGCMVFFRVASGTVHAQVGSGETKIGNADIKEGLTYRMKAVCGNGYIALYYRPIDQTTWRDIGALQVKTTLPSRFQFISMMLDYDIDNVVFTSNGGDVIPDKKVRYLNVNESDKIVLSGKKAAECTFESQKPEVVAVKEDGTIEALKPGGAKIDVKDKDGNIVECIYVAASKVPDRVYFDHKPLMYANIPKDSNRYDEEVLKVYENDLFDLRAYISSDATLKSLNWSVEPEGILDLWGTYPTSPTRSVTALKPGKAVVTAKSAFCDAQDTLEIEVLPESEREIEKSETYDFYATGEVHQINPGIVGAHVMGNALADLKDDKKSKYNIVELLEDVGIKSVRGSSNYTAGLADPSKGETAASKQYTIPNNSDIQMVCAIGSAMVNTPETYQQDIANIVQYVRDAKDCYDGELIFELFNEVYSISFKEKFPTCQHYVDFIRELVPKLREVAPDAQYIACGYGYTGTMDMKANPSNQNLENQGDPAYTQAGRAMEWDGKIKTLVEDGTVDGVTIHPYQSIGSHWTGLNDKSNMNIRFATVEQNRHASFWESDFYNETDFYYTEFGQLEAMIYWGPASGNPSEKTKYNYQKYPVAAMMNLASLLNCTELENIKTTNLHAFVGSDGFGIIDDTTLDRDYKIPNEIVYNKMSKVVTDNTKYYDLAPSNMTYRSMPRVIWNGFPDEMYQVENVQTWGFGDDNGLKEVAFFNKTDAPQKVKISGTKLKPNWSYGGDYEKLMPENLKNESYPSWAPQTKTLANADAYTWLPETHEGAEFADEIEIPPYTIMFANVEGTPQTKENSTNKVSDLANYSMRNAVVLGIGKADAYVDKIKKQIDEETTAVVPVIENERTLLPLRFVAESFGCDVSFDDATKDITIKNDKNEIHFTLGSTSYTVNGEQMELDVAAFERDGRTLIPVRALVEALGKDVYWDARGYIWIGTKSYYMDQDITKYFDEYIKLYN